MRWIGAFSLVFTELQMGTNTVLWEVAQIVVLKGRLEHMRSKLLILALIVVSSAGAFSNSDATKTPSRKDFTRIPSEQVVVPEVLKWDSKPEIEASAESLFSQHRFDELEKKAEEFRKDLSRDAAGQTRLAALYNGLNNRITVMSRSGMTPRIEEALTKWKKAYPVSIAQGIAEVKFHLIKGWNARGSGFANTVQPQAWEIFHSELKQAYNLLLDLQKQKDVRDPEIASLLLQIYRESSMDQAALNNLALKSINEVPTYEEYHRSVAWSLLPRWGGSPEEALEFANTIRRTAPAPEGDIGYYRFAMTTIIGEGYEKTKFPYDDLTATARTLVRKFPEANDVIKRMLYISAMRNDKKNAAEWGALAEKIVNPTPINLGPKDFVTTSMLQQQIEWGKGHGPNPLRRSALEIALDRREHSRLEQLLKSGDYSTTRVLSDGDSLLQRAILRRDTSATAILLRNGANPYEVINGNAIICVAVDRDDVEILKLLLPYYPDPYQPVTFREGTLLMFAAANKKAYCARYILENTKYDLKHVVQDMTAPLLAAGRGDRIMVEMFLNHGFDINTPGGSKNITMLAQAGYEGHTELVQWLLEKGADPTIKSVSGYYPWEQAEHGGRPETMRVLRDAADSWEAKHGKK